MSRGHKICYGEMMIGNRYKVVGETYNLVLSERHGAKWEIIGYYGKMQHLLTALVEKQVKESDLRDVKTLVAKLDELYADIKALPVSGIFAPKIGEG